jgi:hypothetical protein
LGCGGAPTVLSTSCSAISTPAPTTLVWSSTLSTPSGAQCQPTGGTLSGSATQTDEITVCCPQ